MKTSEFFNKIFCVILFLLVENFFFWIFLPGHLKCRSRFLTYYICEEWKPKNSDCMWSYSCSCIEEELIFPLCFTFNITKLRFILFNFAFFPPSYSILLQLNVKISHGKNCHLTFTSLSSHLVKDKSHGQKFV